MLGAWCRWRDFGVDARWYAITGHDSFFHATKTFHNLLQGWTTRSVAGYLGPLPGGQQPQRLKDLLRPTWLGFTTSRWSAS